jgi:hypothetical protein
MQENETKESELEENREEDVYSVASPEEESDSTDELNFEEEIELLSDEIPEHRASAKGLSENLRYSELRALGLSPGEAYLATMPREARQDNRSHLTGAIPRGASAPKNQMSRAQLEMARSIFDGLDDSEIRRLYKKVTN